MLGICPKCGVPRDEWIKDGQKVMPENNEADDNENDNSESNDDDSENDAYYNPSPS
jgi:hypothetical protein